jgi:predicted Zn-dependent protease
MIVHRAPPTLPFFARARLAGLALLFLLASACILQQSTARPNPGGTRPPAPSPSQASREPAARALAPKEAARLQRVMGSLIRAMDHPLPLDQVRVGIADDPHVNAPSAGGGQFLVTTGLLRKANDTQLAGVLGHELAHDDLGHVAKAQALGAGLDIGMVLLDRLLPGSGQLTPIAGGLIARAYSRSEEYVADRHGVTILTRAGYPAATMRNTLIWLAQTEGESSGGFFSTHPASGERIEALRELERGRP